MSILTKLHTFLNNYTRPSIIYDLEALERRATFLKKNASNNNIKLLFSVKSFSEKNVLNCIKHIVDGFEVSNQAEYQLLPSLSQDMFISVNDPTININELENYYAKGNRSVLYNIDNVEDMSEFPPINHPMEVGFRVSHTQLKIDSPYYSKRIAISRFGESLERIFSYFDKVNRPFGIHLHNGSEANTKYSYLLMAESIMQYLQTHQTTVNYINFGGGLHTLLDEEISLVFKGVRKIIPENIIIFFEPGHAFCQNVGFAIAKIQSVKERNPREYIVTTDISYECNLKWSIPKYYSQHASTNPEYVDVIFYGSSCYENDFIRDCKIEINEFKHHIKKNKLVIFHNINGYAYAWNHCFNGIPEAKIYFI